MSNPTTIDRRDVAHPTNPIGGNTQIEQDDPGQPPETDAERPLMNRDTRTGSLAHTETQKPNLPDTADSENSEIRTSFEQPVEGAENKLRINPETKLQKIAPPDGG